MVAEKSARSSEMYPATREALTALVARLSEEIRQKEPEVLDPSTGDKAYLDVRTGYA